MRPYRMYNNYLLVLKLIYCSVSYLEFFSEPLSDDEKMEDEFLLILFFAINLRSFVPFIVDVRNGLLPSLRTTQLESLDKDHLQ